MTMMEPVATTVSGIMLSGTSHDARHFQQTMLCIFSKLGLKQK